MTIVLPATKRRLNILVSSTRQWNPGDEFIRFGVMRLIKELLGPGHNLLLWNRNPDLFVDGYDDSRMRKTFFSNCCRASDIDLADLVIFAGTPEWFGPCVYPLFDLLADKPRLPALFLGIGAGMPFDKLRYKDGTVLKRGNVLITTRSLGLAEELQILCGVSGAIDLPCPSLFCVPPSGQPIRGAGEGKSAFIMQSDAVINHKIAPEMVNSFLRLFPDPDKAPDIICAYIDEFARFSKLGYRCRYSFEAGDYFAMLRDYAFIISTRLHGALPALALDKAAALLAAPDNIRIRSTQKMYGPVLPVTHDVNEAYAWTRSFSESAYLSHIEAIRAFAVSARGDYLRLLKSRLTIL